VANITIDRLNFVETGDVGSNRDDLRPDLICGFSSSPPFDCCHIHKNACWQIALIILAAALCAWLLRGTAARYRRLRCGLFSDRRTEFQAVRGGAEKAAFDPTVRQSKIQDRTKKLKFSINHRRCPFFA
jgi:hypothetical protein